jgi:nicotinamide riboside transporter PnuC
MLKNVVRKILLLSLTPFILWLIPGFTDNVSINFYTILFGLLFITLCLSTSYKHPYARFIALISMLIILYVLYQEGLRNDMFGSLYPIGLFLFSLYYSSLNLYTYSRNKHTN